MPTGDLLTRDGQLQWCGLVLGAGTPFGWSNLEGWLDLPEARESDIDRTGAHGSYPGQLLTGARTVTFTYVTKRLNRERFPTAIEALRRATAPAENPVEEPLVVRLHGRRWMALARCTKRAIPTDLAYSAGFATGAIEWRATNPRLFELPQQERSTRLATPGEGGLVFPARFPLRLPQPEGGTVTVTNTGNAAAWPVWRVTGPVRGPVITEMSTGRRLAFDPEWTVPRGEVVEIDTDARTVLTADTHASRSHRLAIREWFPIPAGGQARVAFSAVEYSPAAELSCLFHNTSM
ncbi:hypothetical protein AB0L13_11430 [Saccharopolyspora shandongensis]|uniref:hypothetical protein n=1 Tax=Saccharopolyspora shandongensis TaxID=418495 RepID=UPI003416EF67